MRVHDLFGDSLIVLKHDAKASIFEDHLKQGIEREKKALSDLQDENTESIQPVNGRYRSLPGNAT